MREIIGDIWSFHDKNEWVAITTNGSVKKNGECVMGRGVALEAKSKSPNIERELGAHILKHGNVCFWMPFRKIVTLPVKHQWFEKADIDLIIDSCKRLVEVHWSEWAEEGSLLYLVRPGCGNGQLRWEDVRPKLEKILDDRFVIVEKNS